MMNERRPLLYVDDEASNLIVFEATFEEEFDVHTVDNAQAALRLLEREPYPVVVSDQRMPEMTGVEMFRIVKHRDPHTQRVILSGFTDSDALIEAINSGQIFQFVRKPWNRDEMLSVLNSAYQAHDRALQNSVLQEKLVLSDRLAMLGRTAATVAHEMGNQLGVLPLIELIEDYYPHEAELVEMAEIAKMTHERLKSLIGEIQSFVRSETAGEQLVRFSLANAIAELLTLIKYTRLAPFELITTEIKHDSIVIGHPFKFQQVLINLIRNAADELQGQPHASIRVSVDRVHTDAIIDVADNGRGIPPEIGERIWEPFFTTKGKNGSGLGLDVVKSIVESQRGSVTFQSIAGEGTTFRVRLPASVHADTSEHNTRLTTHH